MSYLTSFGSKKRNRRGFTLIELLVVISIIGMLSSVVLVSLQGARIRAINARIQQDIGQFRNQLELERTNTGYPNLKSGAAGIAYYNDLSTSLQTFVNDMLKQQGSIAPSGYPGGAINCSGGSPLSVDSSTGVVVTTNSAACGTVPTEYAVYSAYNPKGSAGFICFDSKGGRTSVTTGGIVWNPTSGSCPGSSGGGGGSPAVNLCIGANQSSAVCNGADFGDPLADPAFVYWSVVPTTACTFTVSSSNPNAVTMLKSMLPADNSLLGLNGSANITTSGGYVINEGDVAQITLTCGSASSYVTRTFTP